MAKSLDAARFFEDFAAGDSFRARPIAVREETILAFARPYDPQPFHTDPDYAKGTIFGGLIASGWQVLSETFAKAVEDGFLRSGGLAFDELDDLRWLKPVRPGDAVHLQLDVLETIADEQAADRGQIVFDVSAISQNSEIVMSYTLRAVVRRRMA